MLSMVGSMDAEEKHKGKCRTHYSVNTELLSGEDALNRSDIQLPLAYWDES